MANPDPSACVYCEAPGRKITREHLWPAALHHRLQAARVQSTNHFWVSRLDRELPNEPVLRDVCEVCNNGPLSQLDAYGCALWDQYFYALRRPGEELTFQYDYDLLLRWLLKLCFNSSRVHRYDHLVYPPLRGYILTGQPPAPQQRLFLQLVPPGWVPPEDLADEGILGGTRLYYPQNHRIGFFRFIIPGAEKTLRAIHLRSFSFFIAFFRAETPPFDVEDFVGEFLGRQPFVRLLPPGSNAVTLVCGGLDAWQSARAARATKLKAK